MNRVIFTPSNVHQGHYVEINGESTGIIVNLYAYKNPNCLDYKEQVDKKIENCINQNQ